MKNAFSFGLARWSTLKRGLTGLVVVGFIGVIVSLALDVSRELARLSTANTDNVQWVLWQAETEIMALEIAALRATADAEQTNSLRSVRIKYDVFYSRMDTLANSPIYRGLVTNSDFAFGLAQLDDFRLRWLPVIDGSDTVLREALPTLAAEAGEMRNTSRRMALSGIEVFSAQRDAGRESVSQTLLRIAILTGSLVMILLVLVGALTRLARMRAEEAEANRITRERIETVISASLDAVVVTDKSGKIIDYNGAAEIVFGYPRSEAIGGDMAEMIVPDHMRKAHDAGMHRYNTTGDVRVIGKGIVQLEAKRKSGEVFPIDLTLARAKSTEGEIFISFIRDISRRVASETALREARDRAIAGEKSKADLLAVMSHEMRTPLNGMLGTLDLIDFETLDPRHKRYLRIIQNSGKVLMGHVNDVLDISRLDSGKFSLAKTRFDLIQLLEEIIDSLRPRAAENGNKLVLQPVHPQFHEVYSDPDRLRQIILNLVGNAIKFTQNGTVRIEVDGHEGLQNTEIRVIDTGSGISESDLARIFEDFVTIDASYKRNTSGTGLGLGISRRLAAALGGELDAESELGDGSIFYVRLPLDPPNHTSGVETQMLGLAAENETGVHDAPNLPRLQVLVVEDNAINRMIVREMLERDGHAVEEARDGNEGVALATTKGYDIILMDISMPGCDGMTATRRIRASGAPGTKDIPIIATTAHAMPQELREFQEAGMDDALIKPLSIGALRKVLSTALNLGTYTTENENLSESAPTAMIDKTVLTELISDLPEAMLDDLVQTLFEEIKNFLRDMPDMLADPGQRQALSAEAHRLAGSTGVFGLRAMTELMRLTQTQALDEDCEAEDLADIHEALVACWQETQLLLASEPSMPLSARQFTG